VEVKLHTYDKGYKDEQVVDCVLFGILKRIQRGAYGYTISEVK